MAATQKHKHLCAHNSVGVAGLPDFEICHASAFFYHLLEWFSRLFKDMSPVDLRALLWGYDITYRSMSSLSSLTSVVLWDWYRCCGGGAYSLTTEQSTLNPLFDNPALMDGSNTLTFATYERSSWLMACTFIHPTCGLF